MQHLFRRRCASKPERQTRMSRKYIRHPAGVPIEVIEGIDNGHEQLHDVSYGGLCFDSGKRHAKNQTLRIRIRLEPAPVEIQGRVVWCRRKRDHFEVGITFTGEDEANRMRMLEQICQIENYRQQVRQREGRELSRQQAALEWIRKHAARFPPVARFSSTRR